jgi:tetratricopeptide (TPR) repeat protein
MIRSRPFGRKRKSSPNPNFRPLLLIVALAAADECGATGYFGPNVYLDNGGKNVAASPEFYWEVEVKRLAKDFTAPEELSFGTPSEQETETEEQTERPLDKVTADADLKDFATALQGGQIKPDDAAKATEQHKASRDFITGTDEKTIGTLPEEFDSEFADYHRGAFAYRRRDWDEARKAWEALLQRPPEQRHYRTVWAAFMLGKSALKRGDPEAVTWFQKTRELAKAGFADSLGMAADSYGWEGRSEWKQGHPEKAARLFLTQLALADESAVVSLKALIPDRSPVEGMLNYGPEPDDVQGWSEGRKKEEEQKTLAALRTAAKDPLLRRLVTAHILATESTPSLDEEPSDTTQTTRCSRWLSVIKDAHLDQVEEAEYLGWVAYINGNYQDAAHWLALAKSDSPAANWLRAKLQRRAGKLEDAANSMTKAWRSIEPITAYTGWTGESETPDNDLVPSGEYWSFSESASGDLGALYLARAGFIPALEVLWKGGLWEDAAFVAERVLTTDELKAYVDQQSSTSGTAEQATQKRIEALRYLLGRRLVREDRYDEAAHYLKAPYDKVLEHYVKALKDGANDKLPKIERARAWFTAAWLARHDGMELMGTEVSPDGFAEEGDSVIPDIAKQRQSGVYQVTRYENGTEKNRNVPIVMKPSKLELQRLAKNKIDPDLRFHYRVIAGALAVRAAGFLADNSDELADVLNTAGLWVKDRDEKIGDRYYQMIERRCPNTDIGRAAIARHWFVDQTGPWSNEQQVAYEKLHQDLGID